MHCFKLLVVKSVLFDYPLSLIIVMHPFQKPGMFYSSVGRVVYHVIVDTVLMSIHSGVLMTTYAGRVAIVFH